MECSLVRVPLERIDWTDHSFRIHSYASTADLETSLDTTGILVPPWVFDDGTGTYLIVNGYKRFGWLQRNKIRETDCLVLDHHYEWKQLLQIRLEEKLFSGELNLAEKAQMVARYSAILSADEIYHGVFPRLRLTARKGAIEGWNRLVRAGSEVLEALGKGWIAERAALLIASWRLDTMQAVVRLFSLLRCSASIQVEILERLDEIARREGSEPLNILHREQIKKIIEHEQWNRREKTAAVRELLYRWRYPRLQAKEAAFRTQIRKTPLPKGITMIPPPAFEGERWRLEILFSAPKELHERLGEALKCAEAGAFTKVFSSAVNTPSDPSSLS